jgi:hypothetical protein
MKGKLVSQATIDGEVKVIIRVEIGPRLENLNQPNKKDSLIQCPS